MLVLLFHPYVTNLKFWSSRHRGETAPISWALVFLSLFLSLSAFSLFRDLPRPQTALLFSPGLSEARNLHARSTLTLPPYLCVACLGKLFHQRNFAIVCFLVVVFFYFSEEKEGPTMTSMNFSRACSLKRTFVERGCLTTSVLPRAKVLKKTSWGVKCLHIF